MSTIKVALIGSAGIGKTAYLNRILTGDFTENYQAGTSFILTDIKFETNIGNVTFQVVDTAGQLVYFDNTTLEELKNVDFCICMFDATNSLTFRNTEILIEKFKTEVSDKVPIFVLRNKVDSKDIVVSSNRFKSFLTKHNYQGFDLSVKSCYNYDKVFLDMLRTKFGNHVNILL